MLAAHMEIWGRLYADIFSCVRFLILLTPGWDAKATMRAVWTGCSCQDARSTEGSPTATKWHGAITMQHWKVSCQKNETPQLISLNTRKGSVTVSILQPCNIWYCWTHGWDWTRHWRIPSWSDIHIKLIPWCTTPKYVSVAVFIMLHPWLGSPCTNQNMFQQFMILIIDGVIVHLKVPTLQARIHNCVSGSEWNRRTTTSPKCLQTRPTWGSVYQRFCGGGIMLHCEFWALT